MTFQPAADIYIPDGLPLEAALARVTHLGIGAHQDDLEFMASHGILECHGRDDQWFGAVTCTNGAGSFRSGPYADHTDEQMMAVRREEQRSAALLGGYGAMIQLGYPSTAVKNPADSALKDDLRQILAASRLRVVYTHNPADKHDTHIGVLVAVIQAMRELPREKRPAQVIGCELWRDLDWLPDSRKVVMDVSGRENLSQSLIGVFDSQISGGKRYDLGIPGRRAANATFLESHAGDKATQVAFGMDLTPLVADESLDILAFTLGLMDEFRDDVRARLSRRMEAR